MAEWLKHFTRDRAGRGFESPPFGRKLVSNQISLTAAADQSELDVDPGTEKLKFCIEILPTLGIGVTGWLSW